MSRGLLGAVAFAAGAAIMIVELMAVRLMAPWFGQSQIVWTNVIGVVLAALAAGQWLGGRWAEGRRGPGPSALLLASGALALGLPDLMGWLAGSVRPADLSLGEAYPFVSLGSLLVSVLGVGVPMLAVGAVTPWLVRLSRDAATEPGRVAGRILGAGTAGSLVGTFAATHLLLAAWGSAVTVRVAGALLLAAGGTLLALRRRGLGRLSLLWLLLPVAASLLPQTAGGGHVLAAVETVYQTARVEELDDGTRLLRLNEGLDSFHSAWKPGALWTGRYFDAFAYPALLAPRAPEGGWDVMVVGLAGGSMARLILGLDPSLRVRGVEIDPAIVALGRRWFGLPSAVDVEAGVDGRIALAMDPHRYGSILVDAYAQQIYLPAHLCTEEFFSLVRDRLLPGGVAALNVGGLSREDPVVAAVAGTFARVFPGATMGRVPGTRNMIVLGWNGSPPNEQGARARLTAAGALPRLEWMVDGSLLGPVDGLGGRRLRDGDAPVEALAHASWTGERVSNPPLEPAPVGADPAARLDLARRRLALTDWAGAEMLLRSVPADASADVRAPSELLLGNIALERGQLDRARRRYETCRSLCQQAPGLAGTPRGGELRDVADANLDLARERLDRQQALAGRVASLREETVLAVLVALGLMAGAARVSRRPRAA